MGIYDEIFVLVGVSGNLSSNLMLCIYWEVVDVVEVFDLNYILICLGWFIGGFVDYEIMKKGELFGGYDVLINLIVDFVKNVIVDNDYYVYDSVGLNVK